MSGDKERQRLARAHAERVLKSGVSTPEEIAAAQVVIENTAPLTMADVEWDDEKHLLGGATTSGGDELVMLSLSRSGKSVTTNRGVWVRRLLTPNGKKYDLHESSDGSLRAPEPSTKTMDEYSPEEQADMVGMWAAYNRHVPGGEPSDFVIIEDGVNKAGRVPCYNPEAPEPSAWAPDPWMLTPRFDLPRAWGANGQPCEAAPAGAHKTKRLKALSAVEDYKNAPIGTIVALAEQPPYTKMGTNKWADSFGDAYSDEGMAGTRRNMLRDGW